MGVGQARISSFEPDENPAPNLPAGPWILVVDGRRQIIEMSPPAEARLREGRTIACGFGRLVACSQCDMSRLDRALEEARRLGTSSFLLGGGALEGDIARMGDGGCTSRFVIVVRASANQAETKVAAAAHAYDLTLAETRLLELLFDGVSLPEAAGRLGVARTTARTHLQRLFDKTGARRQGDLLRCVALTRHVAGHRSGQPVSP